MSDDALWRAKLAARIHDPAEKALVLLRDPAGHEGGTSRALSRLLGLTAAETDRIDPDNDEVLSRVLFDQGLPRALYRHVQRADWWAAAADRPQWPMQEITVTTRGGERKTLKVADWAQVRWTQKPILVHPLTGEQYSLPGGLSETDIADIKRRSFEHFSRLLQAVRAQGDSAQEDRRTLFAFWRFGPELVESEDFGKLGALWKLLPADTRVPDHSIWDHLDLTSAFAGAFAADPNREAALLALSMGPVQSFIAASRTTSDLWAGSHLLARLSWEAMRPVCERLGPDAILFPRLRGVAQVDLWLRDAMGLPREWFEGSAWMRGGTDANQLFSAALPNRFVAVVPAAHAREIAAEVEREVRAWIQAKGREVVDRLLDVAGLASGEEQRCHRQMREQLEAFPQMHWAAVPFSLIRPRNAARQADLDVTALGAAMAPFFGAQAGEPCGFLDSPAWQVLQQEIVWSDDTTFFPPNPGVLYPAVFDLAERVLAAAKAARPFDQLAQRGWRDSLTGEAEWLTTDLAQLGTSPRQRTDTLWARVAAKRPAWARKGEHLGALSALKRLWPALFADEVGRATGREVGRFVVSTHTMALAHQLDRWLGRGGPTAPGFDNECRQRQAEPVALPRQLMQRHGANPALADAKRIPGLLDAAREAEDDAALARAERLIRRTLASGGGEREDIRLETYYGLLMMDGDRMGAILSGDAATATTFRDSFHPDVRKGFDERAARQDMVRRYGGQRRPISPNRHLAISAALNDFSQVVVRHVVEEEHLGRVIYAGGDDVLAMAPVADLLSVMQRLRHAYSGTDPEHDGGVWRGLTLQKGFAALANGRGLQVMRMMGHTATASCGAVVAHHQAPLAAVLRELRVAEQRAKNEGGRDAFSITVIKRSGGAAHLTEKWGEPMALLAALIDFLRTEGVSRRAVYNSLEWLEDLPDPADAPEMLERLLAYQLARQAEGSAKAAVPTLAARLAKLAADGRADGRRRLADFMRVAEFLAREIRSGADA